MKENIEILVVDDSEDERMLTIRSLKHLGYSQIREAVNGINAIDLARDKQKRLDLIIMDTEMGTGARGYEACRLIRQEQYGGTIGIIGMSNNPDPNIKTNWIEAGADAFIDKNDVYSNRKGLGEVIEKILRKYQLQQ